MLTLLKEEENKLIIPTQKRTNKNRNFKGIQFRAFIENFRRIKKKVFTKSQVRLQQVRQNITQNRTLTAEGGT